jgi:hypothetical protein
MLGYYKNNECPCLEYGTSLTNIRTMVKKGEEIVKFWSVSTLSDFLGVPKSWIYDRTRANGPEVIPHVKFGKYVRFEPESRAFQKWLERPRISCTVQSSTI